MFSYTNSVSKLTKSDYMMLVEQALIEDSVAKDVTSLSIFNLKNIAQATIITRQNGIIAGLPIIKDICKKVDPNLKLHFYKQDGDKLLANDKIVDISGKTISILATERVCLNFLGLLSGMATLTYNIVQKLEPYNIKLLDTRKTIPGYRKLSKYAVYIGGGNNHRLSLSDMGLIKDNHIAAVGSIAEAIHCFQNKYPKIKVQVEVDTFEQLKIALPLNPTAILLDNMNASQIKKCVAFIKQYNLKNNKNIWSEASGGFNINNISKLKDTGVDYVSMSSITMDANNLDLSLEIYNK